VSILYRESRGNLHLRLSGDFTETAARNVLDLLSRSAGGEGRVFVDTAGLESVSPQGAAMFEEGLDKRLLPPDRLFFKGRSGQQVAPQGYRVLITPEGFRCSGCAGCPARGRQDLFSLHRIAS